MKRDTNLDRLTPPDAPPAYDDASLRVLAAQAIESGWLPAEGAARIWGGPGSGALCAVCRKPVRVDEPEIELEFDRSDGGIRSCQVHARCCAAWEAERHGGIEDRQRARGDLKVLSGDGRIRAREKATPRGLGEE